MDWKKICVLFDFFFFLIFPQIVLVAMILVAVSAKPQVIAPVAYNAPLVAPALATSAVVSREFHGNNGPFVAAYSSPYVAASPYVASPYLASPYAAAYSAPLLLR